MAAMVTLGAQGGKLMLDCHHSFLIPDDRWQLKGMRQCMTKPDSTPSLVATNSQAQH